MSLEDTRSIQQAIDEAYALIAEKHGLDKNEVAKLASKSAKPPRSVVPASEVLKMYKAGLTTQEIAALYGVTSITVQTKLKNAGLGVRQIRGLSTFDIFNELDEEDQRLFLGLAAYGDRAGTPLAVMTANALSQAFAAKDASTLLAIYEDEPVFTREELQAWAGEEEEEAEEEKEEEKPAPRSNKRKRGVFEEEEE